LPPQRQFANEAIRINAAGTGSPQFPEEKLPGAAQF
jgi:hypothetical protein